MVSPVCRRALQTQWTMGAHPRQRQLQSSGEPFPFSCPDAVLPPSKQGRCSGRAPVWVRTLVFLPTCSAAEPLDPQTNKLYCSAHAKGPLSPGACLRTQVSQSRSYLHCDQVVPPDAGSRPSRLSRPHVPPQTQPVSPAPPAERAGRGGKAARPPLLIQGS